MSKVDLTALPGLIAIVEQQIATIPELDWKAYSTSHPEQRRAIDAAKAALEPAGARFRQKSYEHAIRLGGFQASSTSSFAGALHNWVNAARKRLAA